MLDVGSLAISLSDGEITPTINVITSGRFTVQVTDGNGCVSQPSVPIDVTVIPLPLANAGTDLTGVCGMTATLSGNAPILGAGVWTQTGGSGIARFSNANAPGATATVDVPGIYTFRWTVSNGGCVASDEVNVTFLPLSIGGSINSAQTICIGSTPSDLTLLKGPWATWCVGRNRRMLASPIL